MLLYSKDSTCSNPAVEHLSVIISSRPPKLEHWLYFRAAQPSNKSATNYVEKERRKKEGKKNEIDQTDAIYF